MFEQEESCCCNTVRGGNTREVTAICWSWICNVSIWSGSCKNWRRFSDGQDNTGNLAIGSQKNCQWICSWRNVIIIAVNRQLPICCYCIDKHLTFVKYTKTNILTGSGIRVLGSIIFKLKQLKNAEYNTLTKVYDTGVKIYHDTCVLG